MLAAGSLATCQPTLYGFGQTARLAETHPALRAPIFLGPADFAAHQLILTIDQRPDEQNDVLPVAEPLEVGGLIHGRVREPVTNGANHPTRTLRFGIENAWVWLRFG
jgi:hypothetical protein